MRLLAPTDLVPRPTSRLAGSSRHPPARRLAAALALLIALAVPLVACSSETTPAAQPTALPEGPSAASETFREPPVIGDQPPTTELKTPAATFTPQPEPTDNLTYIPVPTLTPTATPYPTPTATPLPTFTPAPPPTQPLSEREALVFLYHATGGPNWNDNTNWLSGAPLKEWHGVLTDSEGRVTGLVLPENQLSGEIPPEMGDLANLEVLDLGGNQLTGEIPPELGNLANLEVLGLYVNQLIGEIPPELGNLANLEVLGLYVNQLTGEIPPELGNLANLEVLYLHVNQLTGEIPPELGNLANLETLTLDWNELSGTIPSSLGSLANLKELPVLSGRASRPGLWRGNFHYLPSFRGFRLGQRWVQPHLWGQD